MARVVRLGIVVVWLALLAVLLRQNVSVAPAAKQIPLPAVDIGSAADEWTGVYHSGHKIGYTHLRVEPEEKGFSFDEESLLRLTVLGTPQTVRTIVRAHTGERFELRSISFELVSNGIAFRVEGESDGKSLTLRNSTGSESSSSEIPLDGPIYLPAGMRRRIASEKLQAGLRYEAPVFDPSVMKTQLIQMTVERREKVPQSSPPRSAWRVEQAYEGFHSTAWVDDDGRVVREEGPLGLTLVRESSEQAVRGNWKEGTALDLVASASMPVEPPLPEPASLKRLRVRIGGIELERVPADARQTLEGDVLTVEREVLPSSVSYRLPYAGDEWKAELAASPLVESSHPRIRALAAEILAGESDPLVAAELLRRFVYGRLEKVPTVTIPSALQALDAGQGDCNEHAVLFTALARAAGIPTRVDAGVVYLEGAFYYHAWSEVWLDRWISVDPVMDQFPADPTHIKFVAGGPEDHLAMMSIIGRLSLEPLAAEG